MILLDPEKIIKNTSLKTSDIAIFESIYSTHDYLKKEVHPSRQFQCCLAETQTHGIGQGLNHAWYSPFGENIYFSLLYSFKKSMREITPLSLVMGLIAAHTLETCYTLPHPIQLKWPNDLLCDSKKMGGILIETQAEKNGLCPTIISMGININMTEDPTQAIDQPWTSVQQQNGQYNDRNDYCRELIQQLENVIPQFETYGFETFIQAWRKKDAWNGKNIQVKIGPRLLVGRACGINKNGHLRLTLPNAQIITLLSGEASLLKD